ncbi:hypothetical protein D4R86_01180 [bacterium]|nr:MAG: hypothetical protein D4R86_01180 [bacterium]
MTTILISKKITKGEELIIIPRKDYERLLGLKISEFQPTLSQKRILIEARKNRKKGNVLTLNEIKNKLGFAN